MEQGQKIWDNEQTEAKVWGKVEAVNKEVILRQDRAVTAYAQAAVKKQPINRELPVMISNALSAEMALTFQIFEVKHGCPGTLV